MNQAIHLASREKNTPVNPTILQHTINKPEDIIEIYDQAKERFSPDSIEYEKTIQSIERYIENINIKAIAADLFLKDKLVTGYGDDYLHLWHLRKLDLNGNPDVITALDYFLSSNKPFPAYYADVVFIAMRHNLNITSFLDNLCIVDTYGFVEDIIRTNNTSGELANILQDYLKYSPFIKEVESVKCLRIMSALTSALAGSSMELFEISVRMQHKFFSKIYRDDIYCERMVPFLAEQDGFIFFVGSAFECKDIGDTAGFARNLRTALQIMPGMKDVVTLLGDKLKQEAASPRQQLDEETGRIKSIIYTMISTGNMAMAQQVLENYEQVNPEDPEISEIREKVEEMLV